MEKKEILKTINLSKENQLDLSDVSRFIQEGWRLQDISINIERIDNDGKELVYMNYVLVKK